MITQIFLNFSAKISKIPDLFLFTANFNMFFEILNLKLR